MTRKQMLKRFRELGGKNKRNGLIITIEKWVGLIKFWPKKEMLLDVNDENYPGTPNCGLCEVTRGSCCNCPLEDNTSLSCCKPYDLFCESYTNRNRKQFLTARRQIINKCRKALAAMDSK